MHQSGRVSLACGPFIPFPWYAGTNRCLHARYSIFNHSPPAFTSKQAGRGDQHQAFCPEPSVSVATDYEPCGHPPHFTAIDWFQPGFESAKSLQIQGVESKIIVYLCLGSGMSDSYSSIMRRRHIPSGLSSPKATSW
jgi:hypothetical protein